MLSSITAMRSVMTSGLAGLGLLLVGCSTTHVVGAEVWLLSRLNQACIETGFQAEKDVVNFRSMPEAGGPAWWFQLEGTDLVGKDMPGVLLTRGESGGEEYVELEASFAADSAPGAHLRQVVIQREQAMLERVIEQCSGSRVTFEEPRMCGRGEANSLCVKGRLLR